MKIQQELTAWNYVPVKLICQKLKNLSCRPRKGLPWTGKRPESRGAYGETLIQVRSALYAAYYEVALLPLVVGAAEAVSSLAVRFCIHDEIILLARAGSRRDMKSIR